MSEQFEKVIQILTGGEVEFVLIGGWAAILHGSAKLTVDVDVVYRRSGTNMQNLATTLAPYAPYLRGAPPGLPFKFDAATIRNGLNFTLMLRELGDVDFLGEATGGGTFESLLPESQVVEAFGIKVRCVNLGRLIQLKRAAGRPKDLEAIAELQAILESREKS